MSDIVVPIGIDAKAGEIALVVQENTIPYDVGIYLEDKNTGKFTPFDEESNSIKIQSNQARERRPSVQPGQSDTRGHRG